MNAKTKPFAPKPPFSVTESSIDPKYPFVIHAIHDGGLTSVASVFLRHWPRVKDDKLSLQTANFIADACNEFERLKTIEKAAYALLNIKLNVKKGRKYEDAANVLRAALAAGKD